MNENLQEILEEEGSVIEPTSQEETQITVQEPFFYQPTPEEIVSYITSVKIQGNGWLVNGNMSVPNVDENTQCQHVKLWLSLGNIPEDEFTSDELEITRVNKIKSRAGEIILARYSELKQRNVALGIITDEAYITKMKSFINDIREQSNTLELDKTKTSDDFIVTEE